ncbi:lysophospholipid acyltransferase family protein [Parachitinimonas caeni]|uniref:Lysophospholipid acyltransferase family protein n=1 Tax=Parachitinimonas caeni TaxID=3031301 RepID=A0ABT7E0S1_9NEIS|nr:lysophospholipid acyltransferase family protein [Parachitinimonas caeni]MDK2124928.1 lysophospholipid acyltransferase family protein [Parachitinimonas caeni]
MRERLDRGWRVIATAIAFSTFGLGGLVLRLAYFPLLQLLVRQREAQTRKARLAVHYTFKLFIELMRVLGILRYEIRGIEKLQRPGLLILANHPTLIDVVFLISLVPDADCVVKASLARNPFTRGPVRATNYICNDSGAGLIEDCIASIQTGHNLIIFPEGTRTPVNGPMKLQRGAANIATRGPCNITPVTIRCEPLSLTKGLPWWKVPPRRMQFTIEVKDDIAVQPFLDQSQNEPALAARQLTDYLHNYFSTENQAHAGA